MRKNLTLLRHVETKENAVDPKLGVKFLGRRLDVDIIQPSDESIQRVRRITSKATKVFSSPSKRCKQTIELISNQQITTDPRLYEIDHGEVEGLYLKQAQDQFPYLFESWKRGEDPKFPNGENSQDVLDRYLDFVEQLNKYPDEEILVCTHNVVLRNAVGYSLAIPMRDWFKISITHFEAISFRLEYNQPVYSGSTEQKSRMLKNVF